MILRLKRRKPGEQTPAKKQNEAAPLPLPPKRNRKEKMTAPKKKGSEKVFESADSAVSEDVVNGLLVQYFPVQKDSVLEERTSNVEQEESEQEESDQEEWSTRRKRKKPEGRRRTGNKEKSKSKKTEKGEKTKTSNKGRERDEVVNPPSQLGPREEDRVPISNDGELEIVQLNSREDVVAISNEQETAPEFNESVVEEQYFPPVLEKRTPNVEQEESDQEECSTRSKRKKPEGRRKTGNRGKGKSKKTKKGEKTKMSDKGQERDEAVNPTSQLRPREEAGLPISNDRELEIVRLNSGDVVAISNEQETEPEFNEPVAEGSCTEKKMVHFNDKGQPIGEGSTTFTNKLGSIARKHCPISYEQWRDVPDQTRDMIWKLITDKYIVPVAYKEKVLHKIHNYWKSFKSILRSKHYDIFDTAAERKRNCPDGVRQELWDIFVDNQSTPVAQARRRAGKFARQAMKTPHTSGRTGAARTAEALKKGNPFATVTRTDLYLAMHSRKDGSCPTRELTDKVEQIKAIAKQDPSSVNLDVDHDPVAQVCGPEKKGFVRGMGIGISKTELFLSGPVVDKLQEERRLRLSAEEQIADLREQVGSQVSASTADQLEEERRHRLSAEEQIGVLKQQVVSQMEQNDELRQERRLRVYAEEQISDLREQVDSRVFSASAVGEFEEERRLRLAAEKQIAVLRKQVVSQMEQNDQLQKERMLRLAAEVQITGLKEQLTSQGEMIADMKQLIKRLC